MVMGTPAPPVPVNVIADTKWIGRTKGTPRAKARTVSRGDIAAPPPQRSVTFLRGLISSWRNPGE